MTNKVTIIESLNSTADDISAAVAQRITALRKAQNLTFDELSRRAAVSKGTLVQIEQERANPSIGTLCKLAAALSVSVADLVSPVDTAQSSVSIVGADEVRTLWRGPYGGSAVLLAGTQGPDMLEMWAWELKPGERFEAEVHGRGTREIIHVISGKLCLEIDGRDNIIATGATGIARTDRPHAYANHSKAPARILMTVHEPLSVP